MGKDNTFIVNRLAATARIEDEIERGEAVLDRLAKARAKLQTFFPSVGIWDESLTMCAELEVEVGAVLIKLRKDLETLELR